MTGSAPASDPFPRLAVAAVMATTVLPTASVVVSVAGGGVSAGDALDTLPYAGILLMMAVLGALITRREPRNAVGWLFCFTPTMVSLTLGVYTAGIVLLIEAPGSRAGALLCWISGPGWVIGLVSFALLLPMLFPDGRPPGPRWSALVRLDVVFVAILALVVLLQPGTVGVDDHRAPTPVSLGILGGGIDNALCAIAGICLVLAGLASAVIRFHRSQGVERLQIRECVFAAFAAVAIFAINTALGGPEHGYDLAYALVPLAVGASILRYRLYEIDVLIRRTVGYAILIVLLAGIYLAGVTLIGGALRNLSGASGTLAVTLSTLAVAAAFQPLRSRVQRFVDRRFYRTGYDAQAAVDAFSIRLREEIDLDALRGELVATVSGTVQPAHTSVWLRPLGEEAGRTS